jgi:hypothetical protein
MTPCPLSSAASAAPLPRVAVRDFRLVGNGSHIAQRRHLRCSDCPPRASSGRSECSRGVARESPARTSPKPLGPNFAQAASAAGMSKVSPQFPRPAGRDLGGRRNSRPRCHFTRNLINQRRYRVLIGTRDAKPRSTNDGNGASPNTGRRRANCSNGRASRPNDRASRPNDRRPSRPNDRRPSRPNARRPTSEPGQRHCLDGLP